MTKVGEPNEMSWTSFEPSASQVHISELPDRLDTKATFLPSGENSGRASTIVEAMDFCGGLAIPPGVGISIRQILLGSETVI
jgi:hypothetical protein